MSNFYALSRTGHILAKRCIRPAKQSLTTMKPQSLQDAIKAAATKKKSKIAQGGWKEPAIKQHKLSADEFKNIKKPQSPVSVSAYAPPSYNNEGGTEVVQRLERECNELKKENLIIVKEMQEYRLEMKQYAQEMKENRSEMDQLRKDMAKMRAETETPKSGHTSDDSLLVPKPSIPQPYTTIELYESQRKDSKFRMHSATTMQYGTV